MDCRIQADRFFNAYKVLSQNDNYFMDQMITAREHNKQPPPDSLETISINIVCLAFSLELYFKDLHFALKEKYPHGHDILKLFKSLPEQSQRGIFAYHATKRYMKDFSELESEIKKISDGFEKWRYSYETRSLRYEIGFVIDLIDSVKIVADRIRTQNCIKN